MAQLGYRNGDEILQVEQIKEGTFFVMTMNNDKKSPFMGPLPTRAAMQVKLDKWARKQKLAAVVVCSKG